MKRVFPVAIVVLSLWVVTLSAQAWHPQAVTDCSICHLEPGTGEPYLVGIHGSNCGLCHPMGFGSTILGPLGTWNNQCHECHNPAIEETGHLEVFTKGHRCVVCHAQQKSTHETAKFHKKHIEEANCVVCHGFIPDTGTEIGSGNRDVCAVCHEGGEHVTAGIGTGYSMYMSGDGDDDIEKIHKKHTEKGLSCLECHNGERPPVDVVWGDPVGNSTIVCQICHDHEDPDDLDKLHEKHVDERLDCGSCHADAELQDDRMPMPPIDDPRRAMVDRGGFNACGFCHGGDGDHVAANAAGSGFPVYRSGDGDGGEDVEKVHKKHVADQWQWCYNCHAPQDGRPAGEFPPVTEPAESCQLCHDDESYHANAPFGIHKKHADENKCYACHQLEPPIFDWPDSWMAADGDWECPDAPSGFTVHYSASGSNDLSWNASHADDCDHYNVYRGADPDFAPSPGNLMESTPLTACVDPMYGWDAYYKITAVDHSGNESEPVAPVVLTSIDPSDVPTSFALHQNTPNPFNPTTVIHYDVPVIGGAVSLRIYDVSGRVVRTLVDDVQSAGRKSVTWDGRDSRGRPVASGVYFYRMRALGFSQTDKMVLMK